MRNDNRRDGAAGELVLRPGNKWRTCCTRDACKRDESLVWGGCLDIGSGFGAYTQRSVSAGKEGGGSADDFLVKKTAFAMLQILLPCCWTYRRTHSVGAGWRTTKGVGIQTQ
jgi:hypothetical protein